jgi:hypothetical protein
MREHREQSSAAANAIADRMLQRREEPRRTRQRDRTDRHKTRLIFLLRKSVARW